MTGKVLTADLEAQGSLTASPWKDIAARDDSRCDPYLIWFDLGFEKPTSGGIRSVAEVYIDVLLELPDSDAADATKANALIAKLRRIFSFEYRTPFVAQGLVQRFICGHMPILSAWRLSDAIARGEEQVRFELAAPKFLALEDVKGWRLPMGGGGFHFDGWAAFEELRLEQGMSLQSPGQQLFGVPVPPGLPETVEPSACAPPLVMVIDDFCNFASRPLRDGNRIVSIWRQGGARPDNATPNRSFGSRGSGGQSAEEDYGAVDPIRPVAAGTGSKVVADEAPVEERHAYYREAGRDGRARDRLPRQWSHGSVVLSMLTADMHAPDITDPDGLRALCIPSDIEFVQLPDVAVADTSGGSLGAFAIDALQRAARLAVKSPSRRDVIVNLSFGTHSGPHDGTSMFERALLDLLRQYNGRTVTAKDAQTGLRLPKLHVVLPAGNTHIERTHASAWLLPSAERPRELKWMILPDTQTDSFMEIWIGDSDAGSKGGQTLEIQLELPTGEVLQAPVRAGQVAVLKQRVGEVDVLRGAILYPKTTCRGRKGAMALLAVAPTQRRAGFGRGEPYSTRTDGPPLTDGKGRVKDALTRVAMEAPPGCWTVRLKNTGTHPVQFHAWIQRSDSAPGRRRSGSGYQGRQSYFVEADGLPTNPEFTLNGIATASCPGQLWVVGAMDERGGIPLYTAAGPDRLAGKRVEGPDVAVTVDRSRNAPGRHVGGVFSGSRLRVGGSSIGAAVFTRMLFHTLYKGGLPMWCDAGGPVPPPVRTAETPAMAADWLRGALSRLRHADQLVIAAARCKVDDKPKR